MNEKPLLLAENVSAIYSKRQILGNVSLSLTAGKFICLSGPNGSGKSTLLSLLTRTASHRLRHDGDITLNGTPLQRFKTKELARNIAFMPQNESSAWNYTVEDMVLSGRFPHTGFSGVYSAEDRHIALETAEKLGIGHLLERTIHTLSGGEFQRVRIARAFAQRPQVLVLDEPAASLDMGVRFSLLRTIKEYALGNGVCVIVYVHDINLAAIFADTLALLAPFQSICGTTSATQQLYIGSPATILCPETLYTVYGRHFGVFQHPGYDCPAVFVQESDFRELLKTSVFRSNFSNVMF